MTMMSELAQALAECPDPKGGDSVEENSVEIKCMTLKEAQAASAGLFHFYNRMTVLLPRMHQES